MWAMNIKHVQRKGKSFMFIGICDIRDTLLTVVKLLRELRLTVFWRKEIQQFLNFKK